MTPDIWFTSDQHFFHKKIIEFCNRPFSSVEEMNEALVENYNKVVKPRDTVYNLGDVSFGRKEETHKVLRKLNGNKTVILGNHDDWDTLLSSGVFNQVLDYLEVKKITRSPVALFHFPIDSWNAKHYGAVHLHGHTHGTMDNTGLRRFDVGVDCWNYRPVHWDEIAALLKERDEQFELIKDQMRDVSFAELYARALADSKIDQTLKEE